MVLHDIPLAQIFALNACHAHGQGLNPAGENYEDSEMKEVLAGIMAAKP